MASLGFEVNNFRDQECWVCRQEFTHLQMQPFIQTLEYHSLNTRNSEDDAELHARENE